MKPISETAYAVAMYRALETERPDALFRDFYARRLAGGRGELVVKIVGHERQIANLIAVRTYLIDGVIERLVKTENIDTVLNLAAGLDMRPYRLCLPPTLRWVEVDLPDVCEHKTQKLYGENPVCCLERVPLDLTDIALRNDLFSRINRESCHTLILTEGLLSYFSEGQVQQLADDLHRQTNFRWWIFEMLSPTALQQSANDWSQKIADQYFADGKSIFRYAPEVGFEFFQANHWSVAEVRSVWDASRRLKRGSWLAGFLECLLRCFGQKSWQALRHQNRIVLLKRQPIV
jgi:methyltransferase (TIGR00027 family)